MYKKYFEGKKAIIFDLDGTIAETSELWANAFVEVAKEINLNIPNLKNYLLSGATVEKRWKYLKESFEVDKKYTIKDLVEKTHVQVGKLASNTPLEPKEGFWNFVYELKIEKEFKIALVTNTHTLPAKQILEKMGMENLFDIFIAGDMVKKPKPNPSIFKKAIKELGLKKESILVFEDSPIGARAAKRAGLDLIVIWDGETSKFEYPRKTLCFLNDFSTLPNNLEKTYLEDFILQLEQKKEETNTKQS